MKFNAILWICLFEDEVYFLEDEAYFQIVEMDCAE